MEPLVAMLANWKTTLTGVASAVVIYEMGVGNKIPETKQEWGAFVLGVLAIMLGLASKDATTGSRPRLVLVPLLALTLTGCAGFGSYAGMNAAEIAAAVKDKNASVICQRGVYAGASVTVIAVNSDKGVPAGAKITPDCGVEFATSGNGK